MIEYEDGEMEITSSDCGLKLFGVECSEEVSRSAAQLDIGGMLEDGRINHDSLILDLGISWVLWGFTNKSHTFVLHRQIPDEIQCAIIKALEILLVVQSKRSHSRVERQCQPVIVRHHICHIACETGKRGLSGVVVQEVHGPCCTVALGGCGTGGYARWA